MRNTVLVVASDVERRAEYGQWLEEAGFEVIACPGPSAPQYTCLATNGGRCPLTEDADVVVLDLRLASDDAMQGTPGWELLAYYVGHGERVVALTAGRDSVHPLPDEDVTVLDRPPDRAGLVDAVKHFARQRNRGAPDGNDPAG